MFFFFVVLVRKELTGRMSFKSSNKPSRGMSNVVVKGERDSTETSAEMSCRATLAYAVKFLVGTRTVPFIVRRSFQ